MLPHINKYRKFVALDQTRFVFERFKNRNLSTGQKALRENMFQPDIYKF